jgi:hypothetical protein
MFTDEDRERIRAEALATIARINERLARQATEEQFQAVVDRRLGQMLGVVGAVLAEGLAAERVEHKRELASEVASPKVELCKLQSLLAEIRTVERHATEPLDLRARSVN